MGYSRSAREFMVRSLDNLAIFLTFIGAVIHPFAFVVLCKTSLLRKARLLLLRGLWNYWDGNT